jgi:hypothetical protein
MGYKGLNSVLRRERIYDADTVTSIEVFKYLQDPYHQNEKKRGLEENMSPTDRAENNHKHRQENSSTSKSRKQ